MSRYSLLWMAGHHKQLDVICSSYFYCHIWSEELLCDAECELFAIAKFYSVICLLTYLQLKWVATCSAPSTLTSASHCFLMVVRMQGAYRERTSTLATLSQQKAAIVGRVWAECGQLNSSMWYVHKSRCACKFLHCNRSYLLITTQLNVAGWCFWTSTTEQQTGRILETSLKLLVLFFRHRIQCTFQHVL